MAEQKKPLLSGMAGKAEKALSGREEQLKEQERRAMGEDIKQASDRPAMSKKWIEK